MNNLVTMPTGGFLYEARLRHTDITEYGFSLSELQNGGRAIPPEGARVDIVFEGTVEGPDLTGSIRGVDYGLLRADGRFELNIKARISTADGENIAVSAGGIFRPEDGAVRENVQLTTASERYAWLNRLQIWALGHADMAARSVQLHAYIA